MDRYSQVSVCYANPQTSDHTPIILTLTRQNQKESKPFRFLNYLCEHQDFLKVVREAWQTTTKGTGLQKLWYKMKNVKIGLKQLHTKEFSGINDKIKEWEGNLYNIQTAMQTSPMADELHQREQEATIQVRRWRKVEDMTLLQNARINKMRNGDENTAYFHATIKERRASITIYELQDAEGKWHNNTGEIHNEITQFYQKLQGTTVINLQMIDKNIMREGRQINASNGQILIQEVSEEKIKEALFGMSDNKAPGVDGFNAYFFKNTRDIIDSNHFNTIIYTK